MTQRQRSSATVDIQCAQCGKPMMMLSFNYTTVERGFESISLRCQYCKAEETRPWPRPGENKGSDQQVTPGDANEPSQPGIEMVERDEPQPSGSSDDVRLPDDLSTTSDLSATIDDNSFDDHERLRLRFARRPTSPPEAPET